MVDAAFQAALGDRYSIERELARGGMATVYVARDVKHDRLVALKVLDPELGAMLGAERFLTEIRVTAGLQHPNILPLFDSGESDGRLWYVMPFVAGESLRARLDRDGALPIEEAMRVVDAVAAALDHAHRHGIVHRDVKPENILLSDGVPVVADFGIAKLVAERQRANVGTNAALTQIGMSLGTPAYMSPEQAMGEAEVDGRTDVYALGVLLYEMLAGALPFTGPTAQAIIAKHIMTPVPSVRGVRDAVPPMIDAAIMRAMAKEPAARFETPSEFARAIAMAPAVEPRPDYSQVTEPVTRSDDPLVGRAKELDELVARLDATALGKGGLVLIGGEPGVGKTRLVEAVLLEARRRGHFCAVGHCYEMDGTPPYLPFLEHLEFGARVVPPGRLRAVLGDGAAEIARIMPALRQLFPDIPAPMELPPDQQRHLLFTRYREYAERSAQNVPVVLLFDDLHWADESTLQLLEHLAPHFARQRILALGTYRDVELEVGRPFAKSLERLLRQRLAERITLRRMPEGDVAALLATLGAPEPPLALVDAIYRATEGNPFFIEEVFRHLREEGRLLDADGRWLPALSIDELEVPEGVRLVIGRRLERVGDDCRAVLTAAAVNGPRFAFRVLEALGELDVDAILDALDQAEKAGLVLSQQIGRETRYSFAHELIRQTLLGTLSPPRRQRRHLRTADAIEKAYGARSVEYAPDLAYHLFHAGAAANEDRTIHWLLIAGRQALAAGAFDVALAQADKGISTLEIDNGRRRAELMLLRGESLRALGRWQDAIPDLEAAHEGFERAGAAEETAAVALILGGLMGWGLGEHSRLMELLRRTLDGFPDMARTTRIRLLSVAANPASLIEGYDSACAMVDEAAALATGSGDVGLQAMIAGARGFIQWFYGDLVSAAGNFETAYRVHLASGNRWYAANFGAHLVHTLFHTGRVDEALATVDDILATAKDVGHRGAQFEMEQLVADAAWQRTGNLDVFMQFAEQATLEFPASGSVLGEIAKMHLAQARLECDDVAAADVLEGSAERLRSVLWRDQQAGEYFRVLAYTIPDRAREVFESVAHRLPAPGRPALIGTTMAMVRAVEGLAVLGDRSGAGAFYGQCADLARLGLVSSPGLMFQCTAGIAAACAERWDLAERHFEEAARQVESLRFIVLRGDVQRWHAWMLLSRRGSGDVERARTMLEESIADALRLGLKWRVRVCESLLAEAAL
ncbi:hypothetical protein BH09GEM1_BH09GEM1_41050 [soil metagenome]